MTITKNLPSGSIGIKRTRKSKKENQGCLGKKRHKSEYKAFEEALRWATQTGVGSDIYKCKWCQGWHLTTKGYVK